jgi:3-methyladenine DNA glycosylase AlkD
MNLTDLQEEIAAKGSQEKAIILQRFFKTGKGEYGEGDIFLGITVPEQRKLARKYQHLALEDLHTMIRSEVHEERLISLLILVEKYQRSSQDAERKQIVDYYLANTRHINNWDLVDLTADKILGHYLNDKDKDILFKLAASESLWERRIAIIATFHFIKEGESEYTFKVAEALLRDSHDLIHKAVGWMLREVGKRVSEEEEKKFLLIHRKIMPRTMLRYAIERFDEGERQFFLSS